MRLFFLFVFFIINQCLAQVSSTPSPYKNLSANKNDIIDSMWNLKSIKTYPHAQSNSECRGEPWFRARCAISDTLKNIGHGTGFPSWGPDQRTDIWWKVLFGKNVVVDSITIYIRADFPHDGYWFKGQVGFSDGQKIQITLDSTSRPQSFKFPQHVTNYVLIDSLVWRKADTWCAFTQVQVFGRDQGVAILPGLPEKSCGKTSSNLSVLGDRLGIEIPESFKETQLFTMNGKKIGAFYHCPYGAAPHFKTSYSVSQKILIINK